MEPAVKQIARGALAVALALASGAAAALGLGQIQVRSKVGEPLLAEIPVVYSDPSELEQLRAQLASPETFRRIGLEPPVGVAADLQFTVALDAQGRPVIRVTTLAPVTEPMLNFLVEVDWGQGRLVREYSALLDAPRTVAAPAQPPIQAPTVGPADTIPPPATQAPAPQAADTTPESVATSPAPTPAPEPLPEPEPQPDTVATAPAPTSAAAPVVEPPPALAAPGELPPVQPGQTLSDIARGLEAGRGYTLDQTMLALLRANPEDFIAGNINLLKAGAVLRVPPAEEIAAVGAAEAAVIVRDQIAQWRQTRQAVPQPAAIAAGEGEAAAAATTVATPRAAAPRVAEARLEIMPPGGGTRPGTRSGVSAGGEGEMLRQELQQTKEDLAARNAEVEELKARVAELEQLQKQQQRLIEMKDAELAAAQQRLAAARQAETAAPAQPAQPTAPAQEAGGLTWLWGGLGLLGAAALAWWLVRRRKPEPAPVRRGYDTATLAAGLPTAAMAREPAGDPAGDLFAADQPEREAMADTAAEEPAVEVAAVPAAADDDPAPIGAAPTWHNGTAGNVEPIAAAIAGSRQQLELARAYLDLGDDDAARAVLREVLDGRDPAARAEAARMLRELG